MLKRLITFQNLSKKVCIIFIIEGRVAAEQDVGYDTDAPHIHCLAVGFLREHLWGDVARGAAGGSHHPALLHLAQPEVADHDLAVRIRAVVRHCYIRQATVWCSTTSKQYKKLLKDLMLEKQKIWV